MQSVSVVSVRIDINFNFNFNFNSVSVTGLAGASGRKRFESMTACPVLGTGRAGGPAASNVEPP